MLDAVGVVPAKFTVVASANFAGGASSRFPATVAKNILAEDHLGPGEKISVTNPVEDEVKTEGAGS